MSGLLALLDDIAALARIAAVQLDDVAGQAAKVSAKVASGVVDDAVKAGTKAAGVVIDDAAVTPKYVHGLPAARELPIVWKIARGSFFNKLVILLPAALVLNVLAPWLLTPLLMLGGAYLCFEGAEKIIHIFAHDEHAIPKETPLDAAHLERERVAGAIKTDFILSAEIMTITLAAIETDSRVTEALVLAVVAIGITALVYGSVALLVKADDIGLKLSQIGRLGATRALGRGIVRAMPGFMTLISAVGTAAMLWVGGSIIVHGLEAFGVTGPGHLIHDAAVAGAHAFGRAEAFAEWAITAAMDGILGLGIGLLSVPVVTRILVPILTALRPAKSG
ncbi:MAG: DUF808 domain-containing protein [Rhodobacteraceae bacterium]|nr:DUF808 domain-containing protein [Paracoccaceae bacterium]